MSLEFKLLGRKRRERVREIAASSMVNVDPIAAASARIKEMNTGSIMGALVTSVMIRLASKLIANWITNLVFSPPGCYQFDEPGYSK